MPRNTSRRCATTLLAATLALGGLANSAHALELGDARGSGSVAVVDYQFGKDVVAKSQISIGDLEKLMRAHETLASKVEDQARTLDTLKRNGNTGSSDTSNLQRKVEDQGREIDKLQRALDDLKRSTGSGSSSTSSELNDLKRTVSEQTRTISDLRRNVEELQRRVAH
ncbi:MAG: hypothetical protein LBE53_14675 [Paucimonas sp.]|jgi:predicted RNase H-like nuclease (RuvC/YqgF family)|nr:hypothetical protein [Paucimonas sp.]